MAPSAPRQGKDCLEMRRDSGGGPVPRISGPWSKEHGVRPLETMARQTVCTAQTRWRKNAPWQQQRLYLKPIPSADQDGATRGGAVWAGGTGTRSSWIAANARSHWRGCFVVYAGWYSQLARADEAVEGLTRCINRKLVPPMRSEVA